MVARRDVLRALKDLDSPSGVTLEQLGWELDTPPERFDMAWVALLREGFVSVTDPAAAELAYRLTSAGHIALHA